MEALRSYARQTDDDTLLNLAKRIKGRAIRRYGQLLREIEPAKNQYDANARAGSGLSTRIQAGTEAGLSERQVKTGLRVAAIPDDQFEAQIDSDTPPTITELAEQGTQKKVVSTEHLEGLDPDDFHQGTMLLGLVDGVLRDYANLDLTRAVRGVKPREYDILIADIHRSKTQ